MCEEEVVEERKAMYRMNENGWEGHGIVPCSIYVHATLVTAFYH